VIFLGFYWSFCLELKRFVALLRKLAEDDVIWQSPLLRLLINNLKRMVRLQLLLHLQRTMIPTIQQYVPASVSF
jgi:hypothetical protein